MEVSTYPNASPAAAAAPKTETANPAIASDFETFLRMRTVQMQNQDPLNPTNPEDFAVQLATFAGVEQQVQTNDLLEALQLQMGLSGVSQFADWIGKEAKAPTSVKFDGATPIEVSVSPDPDADAAHLVVRDKNGLEVDRYPIALDDETISYDGMTASGAALPEGVYGFSVENMKNGGLDSATPANVYAKIVEARIVDGKTILVTEGGGEVAADLVTALREPKDA